MESFASGARDTSSGRTHLYLALSILQLPIMPGIPKHSGHALLHDMYGHHKLGATGLAPQVTLKATSSESIAKTICYVPPQMDPLAASSTRAARQSPMRLLMQDAGVLITMLPYLPNVFLP